MCILKSLRHENIVLLHEIIQDVDRIVLIFEYIDNDLKMYIDKNKGIRDINIIKVSFILKFDKRNECINKNSNLRKIIITHYSLLIILI